MVRDLVVGSHNEARKNEIHKVSLKKNNTTNNGKKGTCKKLTKIIRMNEYIILLAFVVIIIDRSINVSIDKRNYTSFPSTHH